jgi:hypothetical protein
VEYARIGYWLEITEFTMHVGKKLHVETLRKALKDPTLFNPVWGDQFQQAKLGWMMLQDICQAACTHEKPLDQWTAIKVPFSRKEIRVMQGGYRIHTPSDVTIYIRGPWAHYTAWCHLFCSHQMFDNKGKKEIKTYYAGHSKTAKNATHDCARAKPFIEAQSSPTFGPRGKTAGTKIKDKEKHVLPTVFEDDTPGSEVDKVEGRVTVKKSLLKKNEKKRKMPTNEGNGTTMGTPCA